MEVLQLVGDRPPFFNNQVQALREKGVNVTVTEVPQSNINGMQRSIFDYLRFYRRVLRNSPSEFDVIHANFGLTAPFAIAQPKRPVVVSFWGSDLAGRYSWVSKVCAKFANEVIVPTQTMKDELSDTAHLIPFGINTELFQPIPRKEARRIIGWPVNQNAILFPYAPHRSVKNFSLAQSIVEKVDEDVSLRTLGDVPYQKMPLYLNAADVLLITSKRESGPLTVKEATLCNVPVVSTDVGFVSDVLHGVSNSYVCSSELEMVQRVEDVLCGNRRTNGRSQNEEFYDFDDMAGLLLSLYRNTIDGYKSN